MLDEMSREGIGNMRGLAFEAISLCLNARTKPPGSMKAEQTAFSHRRSGSVHRGVAGARSMYHDRR